MYRTVTVPLNSINILAQEQFGSGGLAEVKILYNFVDVLLLVEHVVIYDWLTMMQHLIPHFIRFVSHREHRVVFPVLRPALLLVEQATKYYWLFVL